MCITYFSNTISLLLCLLRLGNRNASVPFFAFIDPANARVVDQEQELEVHMCFVWIVLVLRSTLLRPP